MHAADRHFVLGYDPGGNGRHGLAILQVHQQQGIWVVSHLVERKALPDVQAVIACAEASIGSGALVATGVDTLTAWCGGPSGWRQADKWLHKHCPSVRNSVASPNSLFGAMSIGGGLVLHWLAQRPDHGGVVTEAHPKVCYHALRQMLHPWAKSAEPCQRDEGWRWLMKQLGLNLPGGADDEVTDHGFDALMGCLAALRGLNGQWTLDLHEAGRATEVHPFGRTYYWWPDLGEL
ncbi:MAG: hypothetical protein AB7I35_08290 [Ramlibacter sp.]